MNTRARTSQNSWRKRRLKDLVNDVCCFGNKMSLHPGTLGRSASMTIEWLEALTLVFETIDSKGCMLVLCFRSTELVQCTSDHTGSRFVWSRTTSDQIEFVLVSCSTDLQCVCQLTDS